MVLALVLGRPRTFSCLCTLLTLLVVIPNTVAAETHVSGIGPGPNCPGTWTVAGAPYLVDGDLSVASVTIEPGVDVVFLGDYVVNVVGIMIAVGTESDSVTFTPADSVAGWSGITFDNTIPGSEFAYCRIEGAIDSAFRITNSLPEVSHCLVTNNSSPGMGGGFNISIQSGVFALNDCVVSNNTAKSNGGGIRASVLDGRLDLLGCTITGNVADPVTSNAPDGGTPDGGGVYVVGDTFVANCNIANNACIAHRSTSQSLARGGGLFVSGAAVVRNSTVRDNLAWGQFHWSGVSGSTRAQGGAIYAAGDLLSVNNVVACNEVRATGGTSGNTREGSGFYVDSGDAEIVNCTIVKNTNHGVHSAGGSTSVLNSILYYNNAEGDQVAGVLTVDYSDVQNGHSGAGNINFNPIFAGGCSSQFDCGSVACADLRILFPSACIDAGDPDAAFNDLCFPPSLGGSRNDMGAYGGPGACWWGSSPVPVGASEVAVKDGALSLTVFPNPASALTSISLTVPSVADTRLMIFDVTGRLVRTVAEQRMEGHGTFVWDGRNASGSVVAPGIYFVRVEAGDLRAAQKVVRTR